jgi:DNA-binding response OmpR family regulator
MAAPRNNTSGQGRPRKALIFLVDDEPALLDLLEVSLQAEGYTLKKFLDPEEALRAFRTARAKPDLLVTDYALPHMNGLDLIERCRAEHPALKAIMVSGSASAEIALGSPVKIDRFVGKPFQPETISGLVRAVLEEAPGVSA